STSHAARCVARHGPAIGVHPPRGSAISQAPSSRRHSEYSDSLSDFVALDEWYGVRRHPLRLSCPQPVWLRCAAIRLARVLSHGTATTGRQCWPSTPCWWLSVPGSSRLARPSTSEVNPGNNPWTLSATLAGSDRTTWDLPDRAAFKIRRAARSTSIDSNGKLSARLNQVYSASCCPLNIACRGLPVRISPGQTVVTRMPDARSSARSPSERPTRANLLELYGRRGGTLSWPPMDAIFTMRPSPRARICGSTARMTLSGPRKLVAISRSKSAAVMTPTDTRGTRGSLQGGADADRVDGGEPRVI